jgi:hypothetical protein
MLKSNDTNQCKHFKCASLECSIHTNSILDGGTPATHQLTTNIRDFNRGKSHTRNRRIHSNIHSRNMAIIIRRATAITKKVELENVKEEENEGITGGGEISSKNERHCNNQLSNMNTYIDKECLQRCGFISDSKRPQFQNKINALRTPFKPGIPQSI